MAHSHQRLSTWSGFRGRAPALIFLFTAMAARRLVALLVLARLETGRAWLQSSGCPLGSGLSCRRHSFRASSCALRHQRMPLTGCNMRSEGRIEGEKARRARACMWRRVDLPYMRAGWTGPVDSTCMLSNAGLRFDSDGTPNLTPYPLNPTP